MEGDGRMVNAQAASAFRDFWKSLAASQFVALVERGRSHNVIVAPTERQWRGGTILHRSYIAYQKATALEMAALALQEAVEGS